MKTTTIEGQLQIDHDRGVIYFHSKKGMCVLRMSRLPTPIPQVDEGNERGLDITHMIGCDWGRITPEDKMNKGDTGYGLEKTIKEELSNE